MKILITGGAGFIGSHVTESLLKRGDKVVCIDNFNDYYSPEQKKNNVKGFEKHKSYKLFNSDILNYPEMESIFLEEEPDKVIHLAAKVGVRPSLKNPISYVDNNVKGTLHILKLTQQLEAKKLVFASSSSVYGANTKVPFSEEDPTDRPLNPYGATKKAGELLCYSYHSMHNMSISCLRFFTVYGERGRPDMAPLKFTRLISEGKEIEVYGNGKTKRDYTYVGDIVQGVMAALDIQLGFETINLGNSNAIELRHLIATIEKEVGKKAKIKQMPMQKGDMVETYADISKAKKLLGFMPKTNIEEGIKRLVKWHMGK